MLINMWILLFVPLLTNANVSNNEQQHDKESIRNSTLFFNGNASAQEVDQSDLGLLVDLVEGSPVGSIEDQRAVDDHDDDDERAVNRTISSKLTQDSFESNAQINSTTEIEESISTSDDSKSFEEGEGVDEKSHLPSLQGTSDLPLHIDTIRLHEEINLKTSLKTGSELNDDINVPIDLGELINQLPTSSSTANQNDSITTVHIPDQLEASTASMSSNELSNAGLSIETVDLAKSWKLKSSSCGRKPSTSLTVCSTVNQTKTIWFYSPLEMQCLATSVCVASAEDFHSQAECEASCIPVKESITPSPYDQGALSCMAPPKAGYHHQCNGRPILTVYYDKVSGKCRWFTYFGCGGSANRFTSIEECQQTCNADLVSSIFLVAPVLCQAAPTSDYQTSWSRRNLLVVGSDDTLNLTSSKSLLLPFDGNVTLESALTVEPGCRERWGQSESRWFYDVESTACRKFQYDHCGGSSNHFLSKIDCEKFCGPNPTNVNVICRQPKDAGSCNQSQSMWYFRPVDDEDSPDEIDGGDKMEDQFCLPFNYSGCGGNQNRFESQSACWNKCGPFATDATISKRKGKQPSQPSKQQEKASGVGENKLPQSSSAVKNSSLRDSLEDTSLAYLRKEDKLQNIDFEPCRKAPVAGKCQPLFCTSESMVNNSCTPFKFERWFFNVHTSNCEHFEYSGCGGSENTFDDAQSCVAACKSRILRPDRDHRCDVSPHDKDCYSLTLSGTPKGDQQINSIAFHFSVTSVTCKPFHLNHNRPDCSIDHYFANGQECLKACVKSTPTEKHLQSGSCVDRCFARKTHTNWNCTGEQLRLFRWSYIPELHQCVSFSQCFLTNQSNDQPGNNFASRAFCEATCMATSMEEVCQLPKDPGPCNATQPRFYYDIASRSCRFMTYGGCLGNANRFLNRAECRAACGDFPRRLRQQYTSSPTKKSQDNTSTQDLPMAEQASNELTPLTAEVLDRMQYIAKHNTDHFHAVCNYGSMHLWSVNIQETQTLVNVSSRMIFGLFSSFRRICTRYFWRNPIRLGGHGLVIQADEFFFAEGLNTVGAGKRLTDIGAWDNRVQSETIRRIYRNRRSPRQLSQSSKKSSVRTRPFIRMDGGLIHSSVHVVSITRPLIIRKIFVDPTTDVHTQCIESYWNRQETFIKRMKDWDFCLESHAYGTCPLQSIYHSAFVDDDGQTPTKLTRYFYDRRAGSCVPFTYTGCGAGSNHFDTRDDCRQICEKRLRSQKSKQCQLNVSSQNQQSIDQCSTTGLIRAWAFSNTTGDCLLISVCPLANSSEPRSWSEAHRLGRTSQWLKRLRGRVDQLPTGLFPTRGACQFHCLPVPPKGTDTQNVCHMNPIVTVPFGCKAMVTRWYYEPREAVCRSYITCPQYGNNFPSQQSCNMTCIPSSTIEVCRLPLDHGGFSKLVTRWYYDRRKRLCLPFYYGGSFGNSNRFLSKAECDSFCTAQDVCRLPLERYSSDPTYPTRYFYDRDKDQCVAFHFTGLVGHGNNFASLSECNATCIGQQSALTSWSSLKTTDAASISPGAGDDQPKGSSNLNLLMPTVFDAELETIHPCSRPVFDNETRQLINSSLAIQCDPDDIVHELAYLFQPSQRDSPASSPLNGGTCELRLVPVCVSHPQSKLTSFYSYYQLSQLEGRPVGRIFQTKAECEAVCDDTKTKLRRIRRDLEQEKKESTVALSDLVDELIKVKMRQMETTGSMLNGCQPDDLLAESIDTFEHTLQAFTRWPCKGDSRQLRRQQPLIDAMTGRPTWLPCWVISPTKPNVLWTRIKDGIILSVDAIQLPTLENVWIGHLEFNQVDPIEHHGAWLCTAAQSFDDTTTNNPMVEATIQLNIVVLDNTPLQSNDTSARIIEVPQGGLLLIDCPLRVDKSARDKIVWTSSNPESHRLHVKVINIEGRSLVYTTAAHANRHQGHWVCSMHRTNNGIAGFFVVQVGSPPVIFKHIQTFLIVKARQSNLICPVASWGQPQGHVKWLKCSQRLGCEDLHNTTNRGQKLTIRKPAPSDVYQCQIENLWGRQQMVFRTKT